jgi:hypothetical protein
VISAHAVVFLEVADDGLNGGICGVGRRFWPLV